jgi:hypothetical protein
VRSLVGCFAVRASRLFVTARGPRLTSTIWGVFEYEETPMSTLRMMAKSHLTVLGIAATIIVGLSAINAAAQHWRPTA